MPYVVRSCWDFFTYNIVTPGKEFNSGEFQKGSKYTCDLWNQFVRFFFVWTIHMPLLTLPARGRGEICFELGVELRFFCTKCVYLEGLACKLCTLHPFIFVLQ